MPRLYELPHPSLRFQNLHIDSKVVAGTDDSQQSPERFGGLAFFADDATHVFFVDLQGDQDTEIVDRPGDLDLVGAGDDLLDDVLEESLVGFHRMDLIPPFKGARG